MIPHKIHTEVNNQRKKNVGTQWRLEKKELLIVDWNHMSLTVEWQNFRSRFSNFQEK